MKRLLLILATALGAAACVYPFSTEAEGQVPRSLVVDGNILVGTVSTFHLRYLQPIWAADYEMRDDTPSGVLWIEDSEGKAYKDGTVTGPSTDFSIDLSGASKSLKYKLHIDFDAEGRHYQTPWLEVRKAPIIDYMDFAADENQVLAKCTLKPDTDEKGLYIMDIEEDWETQAQYWQSYDFILDNTKRQGGYYAERTANPHYYCWKKASSKRSVLSSTKDMSEVTLNSFVFHRFSRYDDRTKIQYAVLLKVRGVSEEGYDFAKMIASNSDITGSLFTPVPSEMRGNIFCDEDPSEMVYGFVDAATIRQKRVFLDGRYYLYQEPYDERFVPDLEDGELTLEYFYTSGNRPVGYSAGGEMLWAPLRCVDCVEAGGTKNKPDYWPNSHE